MTDVEISETTVVRQLFVGTVPVKVARDPALERLMAQPRRQDIRLAQEGRDGYLV